MSWKKQTTSWKKWTERPGPSGHTLAGGCGRVPYFLVSSVPHFLRISTKSFGKVSHSHLVLSHRGLDNLCDHFKGENYTLLFDPAASAVTKILIRWHRC